MRNKESSPDESKDPLARFSQAEIQEGMLELLAHSDSSNAAAPRHAKRATGEDHFELILQHDLFGSASVKPKNLVVSWKNLIFAGGAIPATYMGSTLTAMTLLGVLMKGVVHVFDEIDARILAVIHVNSKLLPTSTEYFYDQTSLQFPPQINKALFMERVVNLSGYGAISIDGDQLRITEAICSIDL